MRFLPRPTSFQVLFTAALTLTLAASSTAIYLASQPTLAERQARIFEGSLTASAMGTASLIGLLNHKSSP